jgi:hypothetical protein
LTLAIQVILAGSSCPCKWENAVKTKTPLIVTASKNSPPVMMLSTPVNEAGANVRTHLRVSVRPFSFQALAIRADQEAYTQRGGETETRVDGDNRCQGGGANSLIACTKFRERSLNLHHNLAYSCGGRCLERRM